MRPSRALLALLAAAALAGCLDDAPLAPAPGTPARLALAASIGTGGAAITALAMEVRVSYRGSTQTESSPVLLHARIPLADAAPRSVELPVDIGPCLRDVMRVTPGPFCEVWIDYRLADDSGYTIDQQYMGPYQLVPGHRTAPDPVVLTVGSNPPLLDSVRAVLVDPQVVRYVPSASDVDGNLRSFSATYIDTGLVADYSEHYLPALTGTFQGAVYAFLPAPRQLTTLASLDVIAYDSKFAGSALVRATLVAPDSTTPRLDVTGAVRVDTLTVQVDFWISDLTSDAEAVEVLFRDADLVAVDPGSDALLGRCLRALGLATGPTPVFTSVRCPLRLTAGDVEVIVVPVQKNLDVGTAGRTRIVKAGTPATVRVR